MKKFLKLFLISCLLLLLAYAPGKSEQEALRPDIHFGKIPLYFVANKGQVNEKARFYAKASRYTLWLTKQGMVFEAHSAESRAHSEKRKTALNSKRPAHSPHSPKIERDVSRLVFLNANKNPEMVPIKETKLRVNYFKGNDKSKWHCDIPTSLAVLYKSLYKNIDLQIYGIEKAIEYDWIVKPGGNHHDIRFEYTSVRSTRLDEQGNLLIETDFGQLMHKRPVSYQRRKAQSAERRAQGANDMGQDAKISPQRSRLCAMRYALCDKRGVQNAKDTTERIEIDVKFKRISNNTYGFEVGGYDKSRELIIDPVVLAYSTYLGGGDDDSGTGIAVDAAGCAYVTGYTYSSDFPTLNEYQADLVISSISVDAFLTKLDTTKSGTSSLIYSTYLGGSNYDSGKGIAVDADGCAYVTGETWSSDFPTLNPYQGYQGKPDSFLTKLDTTKSGASSLIYSTYLGGSNYDNSIGIAVDGSGCAYVTGYTGSSDFPILNEYQADYQGGYSDVFITKLDTTKNGASSLIYSTYLGGSDREKGFGIAVDAGGCAYVTGTTNSRDFPTLDPYQGYQGKPDTFLTKLDTTKSGASSLIYSTYLGGSNYDNSIGIAVDGGGCAYVTGDTRSSDFPTLNEYQADLQSYSDAFLTKLDTTKNGVSSLIYSTYLGGSNTDYGRGIAVDGGGCAYMTGHTFSTDFPTLDPYQVDLGTNNYTSDAFITKLDTTKNGASSLIYSTYLGGSDGEYGRGIAVDGCGCVYVTGYTYSSDFPTLNGYPADRGSNSHIDAFITKLVFRTGTPAIELNRSSFYFGAVSGGAQTGPQTLSVGISGGYNVHWTTSCEETWIQVSPTSATGSALTAVSVDTGGMAPGTYTGTISITCPAASNSPRDVTVHLTVYDAASTSVPFGQYATPVDNSIVSGSVPFTGWALDDVGVDSVKLYRRHNGSLVYIGDAVFVEGARPDVEQAYPDYPFNYRAGWAYMMLTHFLPNNGNGTFAIEAVATDIEGHQVSLGTRTVVVDNAGAVKPFGAIDYPEQGGMASGSGYRSSGWVLTPLPNTVPTDGSTIAVYIDGVFLGNPVYNVYRSDIASLFPGYNNSDGAHAYVDFDTTAYENGIHTIYWTAEDDAGNIGGIGSRYFSIQNAQGAGSIGHGAWSVEHGAWKSEDGAVDCSNPVTVKRGCGRNIEPQKISPDPNGIITVETRELERVVIHLDGDSTHSTGTDSYMYLNTGGRLRPLPIGSTFDAERDIFYWHPGPGFIYQYDFVFFKKRSKGHWQKKRIRVVIKPKNYENF